MYTGAALAAILSPVVFGVVIDATGDWNLPFLGTMALMLAGIVASFLMRPDLPFDAPDASAAAGTLRRTA